MEYYMEKDIEYILDYFDFDRVHKTMEALDWHWASTGGVPMVGDIRRQARTLLKYVAARQEPEYFTSTGGLVVTKKTFPEDPKPLLELSFRVAEWSNECVPEDYDSK